MGVGMLMVSLSLSLCSRYGPPLFCAPLRPRPRLTPFAFLRPCFVLGPLFSFPHFLAGSFFGFISRVPYFFAFVFVFVLLDLTCTLYPRRGFLGSWPTLAMGVHSHLGLGREPLMQRRRGTLRVLLRRRARTRSFISLGSPFLFILLPRSSLSFHTFPPSVYPSIHSFVHSFVPRIPFFSSFVLRFRIPHSIFAFLSRARAASVCRVVSGVPTCAWTRTRWWVRRTVADVAVRTVGDALTRARGAVDTHGTL